MSEAKKILPTIKITKEKNTGKGKGKTPVISHIEILYDNELVATASKGGDYTEKAVLQALKTPDRKTFKVVNKMLFDTLT